LFSYNCNETDYPSQLKCSEGYWEWIQK